ncbi:MAG TPA: NADH-quinone oxidoreductase subunit E, partial [Anaerolineae bacterium]|nr:NADH-quinone oxidoreductase subunit E [Anaerolineae bacterium]
MSHDSADLTLFKDYLAAVAPQGRAMLLPALHQAQSIYGWLPTNVQDAISRALHVPLADIHGVIEFYTMFYNAPMAKKVVRVCEDSACRMQGAAAIMQAIEQKIGLQNGETNDVIAYEHVPCLGLCEHAPAALIGEKPAGDLQVADVDAFLAETHPEPNALPYGEKLYTLARIGRIDPTSLSAYSDAGGYTVLPAVLKQSPDELIKNVDQLAIFGRGGAQFPLGRKWLFTRGAAGAASDKHIVVNSDESEPGTFKDRGLIEEDPFAIIEAMTIAAYAVG